MNEAHGSVDEIQEMRKLQKTRFQKGGLREDSDVFKAISSDCFNWIHLAQDSCVGCILFLRL